MAKKAFVLHSGGVDSTVCLFEAVSEYPEVESVSVNYDQRHKREILHAREICDNYQIPHTILNLSDVLGGAMLTGGIQPIPSVSYADLPYGVSPTYVPFRNGTLLSLVTAHAQKWVNAQLAAFEGVSLSGMEDLRPQAAIYFGAHAEDAHNWAYPDCTPEFIGAMANAIYIGTYRAVRLHTPLMWMTKDRIIKRGCEIDAPLHLTFSCYAGGEYHCGTCPTCRSRRDGFRRAGVDDPTVYFDPVEA